MLNAVVRVRFAFNRTNFVLGVMTLCDYLRFGFRCIFFTVSLCYSDVINMRFINAIARNSLVALRPCVWFSIVLVPQHTFIYFFFLFSLPWHEHMRVCVLIAQGICYLYVWWHRPQTKWTKWKTQKKLCESIIE